MSAIWKNDGAKWTLLAPTDFPDEATLHSLVEDAPQLLPLAGKPNLIILGKEVQLGTGYADLIGVEPSGRMVVIEIKLARNAEARRAVVSQALAYAAFLYGLDIHSLEKDVLSRHLRDRGFSAISDAVESEDQAGEFVLDEFTIGLSESLAEGRFRIVFVLDESPEDLVRLVGYLESVSAKLVIDLVTISSYRIGDSTVLVPQRVDPERFAQQAPDATSSKSKSKGHEELGAKDFVEKIAVAQPAEQAKLKALSDWAIALEEAELCQLSTVHGVNDRWIFLLPRLKSDKVSLVSIWNDGKGYLQFWKSVFERRAPKALERISALIAPVEVRQGNSLRDFDEELLNELTSAYEEATEIQAI